jgi:transposase
VDRDGSLANDLGRLAADADDEYAMIDSTIVRAHQHSAGAPKKHRDQAIGHSRGGPSTKIHALVHALGPAMAAERLIADKAFDADARVLEPQGRQIGCHPTAAKPPVATRIRPGALKERHLIENFFCKLNAIATRYDKTARNFLGAVQLAAAIICLN